MSPAELIALLAFCTAMSFSPGPNTTLSTAMAANLGLRRLLWFNRALALVLVATAGWMLFV